MFASKDLIVIGILIIVPVVCSLTLGRNGTFTDNKKFFASFGLSAIIIAIWCYSDGMDIKSIILDTVGGTMLFGTIGSLIIEYFNGIWEAQEYERQRLKKDLEIQEEINRQLRDELEKKK